ncbi:quinone oxidoreductase [Mesorhizobium sp. BR1-1-16]|uniref:quinone oxidoreductase family protein n=1 Tax=Mesorhizobium sp. BR1-1-16 TaxID=2876653 RepID=UPI001CCD11FF|nr:quinone oxidoreductase [Mesorhizobium sp. BR1-1-16]MBZ9937834.1 quinone oxidoreductase [Mesorhizobium sp. BR1-1-16]
MTRAIRIHAQGGPEALRFEAIEVGAPGPGEVRLRHTAIGLNFIDVYHRSGLYPPPQPLPFVPGSEGVGVVEAVGEGVADITVGDRVGYAGPTGAYSEVRLAPVERMVPIPEGIDDAVAASVLLKGLTARYLLRQTYVVTPQTVLLFHAAAGGVGSIACQWAAALGATVIGTAGSAEKVERALSLGCDHVINYREEDFVQRVAAITEGAKCDVVYDSVGKDTFIGSLDCLKPRGMLVSFGNSSGAVPPFEMNLLQRKGSLYATRPTLGHYVAKRSELLEAASDLFGMILSGKVRIDAPERFPLADAAAAQTALEGRHTQGSVVLIPKH